ncbi:MAG: hypothetical protein EKE20_14730 [Candidatus Symbiopectobacterium sp. Dall1.0]|nr:hypothetical protein [Candidatus Symbiopectobacterium sp. Dall1.0]
MGAGRAEVVNPSANLSSLFPDINYFLHRPLIEVPALCDLYQLVDGTYSINDLSLMHDILDLRKKLEPNNPDNPKNPEND